VFPLRSLPTAHQRYCSAGPILAGAEGTVDIVKVYFAGPTTTYCTYSTVPYCTRLAGALLKSQFGGAQGTTLSGYSTTTVQCTVPTEPAGVGGALLGGHLGRLQRHLQWQVTWPPHSIRPVRSGRERAQGTRVPR